MKKIFAVALMIALMSLSAGALAATGLGAVTTVSVTPATAEKAGSVSSTVYMCAVTLDEDGRIVTVEFDAVQPQGSFDATGAVAGEVNTAPQTKVELGEGYGMKKASPIGKEWGEQMDALEAWCTGKTAEEVLSMELDEKGKATDVDLLTGCTVHINDQLEALRKAVDTAK